MEHNPDFFNEKSFVKTPLNYKEIRNTIIRLYNQNPQGYLAVDECTKNIMGDNDSIMLLHQFLENWGLINFSVEPHYRPLLTAP